MNTLDMGISNIIWGGASAVIAQESPVRQEEAEGSRCRVQDTGGLCAFPEGTPFG